MYKRTIKDKLEILFYVCLIILVLIFSKEPLVNCIVMVVSSLSCIMLMFFIIEAAQNFVSCDRGEVIKSLKKAVMMLVILIVILLTSLLK